MNKLDELFKNTDKELSGLVEDILENAPLPENPLKPPEQTKKEAFASLADFFTGKDIRIRVEQGFKVIFRELASYATPLVMDDIKAEWVNRSQSLIKEIHTAAPSCLQEDMNVSDETIEHFYQCGFRVYSQKNYQEAADVFFVISLLSPRRHNIWMALGLSEKELNNHAPALVAFSMAALTNMEDPLSFFHSAECYIALGEKEDAKECIEVASDLLKGKSDLESKQLANAILSIKKSLL